MSPNSNQETVDAIQGALSSAAAHAPMAYETFVLMQKAVEAQCKATAEVTADRDRLQSENEKLKNAITAMRSALGYWLPINVAVNKLPIGNFYLPETEAGFICAGESPV